MTRGEGTTSRSRAGLLTINLMDRSKLESALQGAGWEVVMLDGPDLAPDLDGAVIDLDHSAALETIEAAAGSSIRCLAYGPHVRRDLLDRARRSGAALALARSAVFRDPWSLAARLAGDRRKTPLRRPRQDSNLRPTA